MQKINRVRTEIPGLDAIIGGGIPEGDLILLSGTCGTGKTIFGVEFLYFGKEPGFYITFEEHVSEIRNQASSFGWDLKKSEEKGILKITRYDPYKLEDILTMIENNIREINATRVVIDSVPSFAIHMRDESEVRRTLSEIYNILKKNNCTSIIISDSPTETKAISKFGVEEFILDGVIILRKILERNEYKRALNVWKMRLTAHSTKFHIYEINKRGLIVYPKKVVDFRNVQFFT
ncbi:MAG: AAA family ATPase [Candidatus Aenigmarchaeota archaeon]|nr:AAA family ATPase [Candidatus Aenigmarchaeota archaeon]